MAFLPRRVSLAGAAGAFSSPPGYRDPRGNIGAGLEAAGEAIGGVVGALARPRGAAPPADPEIEAETKRQDRAAQEAYAAVQANLARTDPASGTAQGASQVYRGTGEARSRTAETGGVTTGAPGAAAAPGRMRVKVPGIGWEQYDPNDPTVREAFAQARGETPDSFMAHRDRTTPAAAKPDMRAVTGRRPALPEPSPVETYSDVPEAAQIENWDRYLRGREAEQQDYEAALAQSRAAEATGQATAARAERLAREPFYTEELAAKGKIGAAEIKSETEIAGGRTLMRIVGDAAAEIDKLRSSPIYASLPPDEKKRLEDQIWDQARLTLSALTKTNLYPRPNPYDFLGAMAGGAPAGPGEEKPAT